MKNTAERVGRLLSRREAMAFVGASGLAWLMGITLRQTAAGASPSPCIVRPEQTEGPYFVDERLLRSDIRSDPSDGRITPGIPLTLTFRVMRLHAGDCRPVPDAQVDVWHCDATGIYSDVEDPGFSTLGKKFLRGHQFTDAHGDARFITIYPGWYPIRTVHIHFKVRTARMVGKHYAFTSQLYFPDELTDRVHTSLPYSSKGRRRVRNHQDFIFRDGGDQLMLKPSETYGGYEATFPIGLTIP
ncbi:MAG: twin-arginine translocation pathway signal protein [Nitrospira sp. SG-bin1]|nr:MAG: twin-arginine translocation pathway signal protein [Nitrospira sp. SG-bin1]